MGKQCSLLISVASICGLVQSIICLGLSIFACLVYLCVVPVAPYEDPRDFYRVTFVKLYFEGPKCIPDGSYLGKFNEEYRDPEKINLLTPDIVFTTMVVRIIFDVAHIVLSILLYKTNKSENDGKLLDLIVGWGVLTLFMSFVDAFLSAQFLLNIFSLSRYLEDRNTYVDDKNIQGIQFIPLILGLISCRLVVFWLWNTIVAGCFLFTGLCCKKVLTLKEKVDCEPEPVSISSQVQTLSKELKRRFSDVKHRSYQEKPQTDWDLYSMEAITRFNDGPEHRESCGQRTFSVSSAEKQYIEAYGRSGEGSEGNSSGRPGEPKRWSETNAAYVRDDGDSEAGSVSLDFGRKIPRFEEDSRSIKIIKRPVGKPVNVPIPPPLPVPDSFSC